MKKKPELADVLFGNIKAYKNKTSSNSYINNTISNQYQVNNPNKPTSKTTDIIPKSRSSNKTGGIINTTASFSNINTNTNKSTSNTIRETKEDRLAQKMKLEMIMNKHKTKLINSNKESNNINSNTNNSNVSNNTNKPSNASNSYTPNKSSSKFDMKQIKSTKNLIEQIKLKEKEQKNNTNTNKPSNSPFSNNHNNNTINNNNNNNKKYKSNLSLQEQETLEKLKNFYYYEDADLEFENNKELLSKLIYAPTPEMILDKQDKPNKANTNNSKEKRNKENKITTNTSKSTNSSLYKIKEEENIHKLNQQLHNTKQSSKNPNNNPISNIILNKKRKSNYDSYEAMINKSKKVKLHIEDIFCSKCNRYHSKDFHTDKIKFLSNTELEKRIVGKSNLKINTDTANTSNPINPLKSKQRLKEELIENKINKAIANNKMTIQEISRLSDIKNNKMQERIRFEKRRLAKESKGERYQPRNRRETRRENPTKRKNSLDSFIVNEEEDNMNIIKSKQKYDYKFNRKDFYGDNEEDEYYSSESENMETGFDRIQQEERNTAKVGAQEDYEEYEKEKEYDRLKMERKKNKRR